MDKLNKQELRRLANAATHDSWYAGNAYDKPFIAKYQVIADNEDGRYVLLEGNQNFLQDAVRNVEFVGAANPAAILSLLDELEENDGVIAVWRGRAQRAEAELEQYRKDAERYREIIASAQRLASAMAKEGGANG